MISLVTTSARLRVWAICAFTLLIAFAFLAQRASAESQKPVASERLVTFYDQGVEHTIVTKAATVKAALAQAQIKVSPSDAVEPSLNSELIEKNYRINIYRARPVLVVDNEKRFTVMTAEQSPRQIVQSIPGETLYDEDKTSFERVDSVLSEGGAGLKLIVDRATVFQFTLYGKTFEARTQAATVGAMLAEKSISLTDQDGMSVDARSPIVAGMSLAVWRNGKQTITQEEAITMPVEEVKDTARELGYREVQTPGADGKKQVTYEIEMRDGVEISRTVIASVTTQEPTKQVITVGAKLPTPTTPTEAQALGKQMMLNFGYAESEWPCLYNLWMRESGWTTTAGNTSSGAYGIPQALPASKMAVYGADYLTNAATQITWGLNYIKGRYQTPCGAWSAFQSKGWY